VIGAAACCLERLGHGGGAGRGSSSIVSSNARRTLWSDRNRTNAGVASQGYSPYAGTHSTLPDDCGVDTGSWKSEVLANRNATYYGMMVARYVRRSG
jgi:hypothetical protein